MSTTIIGKCPICGRDMIEGKFVNQHHLIPKCKEGRYTDKITIHSICHNKIHSIWKESELANYYNTVERIMTNPDMKTFVKWVAKKPLNFYAKTKLTSGRHR